MPVQDAHSRHLSVLERLELGMLPEDGLRFDEELPILWLAEEVTTQDTGGLDLAANVPGRVDLRVTPIGPMETRPPITIRGKVTVTLDTACVRCLSDVKAELCAELDAMLMFDARRPERDKPDPKKTAEAEPTKKKKKKKGKASELEVWDESFPSPEELGGEGGYTAEGVDLAPIVREAILLAMHMNPACADEAACDARTQAMLDEVNRAAQEAEMAGDPRWAALAALRKEE